MDAPVRTPVPGIARLAKFPNHPGRPVAPAEVRFLRHDDIERLIVLEHKKWTAEQAAAPADLAHRISAYPRFCFGAFSSSTGEALASMFLKPISLEQLHSANTWADCAKVDAETPEETRSLFGISLTSIEQSALDAIVEFFVPLAIEGGWSEIYLGSPLPGLRAWRQRNPNSPVADYVYAKRNDRPLDPQLYYYHEKGFNKIEACKPDYFPHERSLDYGAVIRADVSFLAGAPR